MKQYYIYNHPSLGYLAIKNGFSWPAFFLGSLWFFKNKEYIRGIAGIFFGIFGVSGVILVAMISYERFQHIYLALLLALLFWTVAGLMANSWLRFNLIGTEYSEVEIVEAVTPDEAITKIKDKNKA